MKLNKFFTLVTKEDKIVMDALKYVHKRGFLNHLKYVTITAELLTSISKNGHIVKIKIFEAETVSRELLVQVYYKQDYIYYTMYQEV